MAEKATIHKINLTLSDFDRDYYDAFQLTVALHPSETHERMMARLMAFCCCAHPDLQFTRGLSSVDEPDIWRKHLDGRIAEWIEIGQPTLERLKKAASQSEQVKLFVYGRGWEVWWKANSQTILNLPKVTVQIMDMSGLKNLAQWVQKSMNLTVSVSGHSLYVISDSEQVSLEFTAIAKD